MDSSRNQRRSFRFQQFKGSEMNQCRTKRSLSGPWAATTIAWTRLNYALIPVWVPSSSNTVELRRLPAFSRFFPPNCTSGGFNFDVSPSLLLPPTWRTLFSIQSDGLAFPRTLTRKRMKDELAGLFVNVLVIQAGWSFLCHESRGRRERKTRKRLTAKQTGRNKRDHSAEDTLDSNFLREKFMRQRVRFLNCP